MTTAAPDEVERLGRPGGGQTPLRWHPVAVDAGPRGRPAARGRNCRPEQVRLRPSALSPADREALAAIVGPGALRASTTTPGCCGPAASPRWICCAARTPACRMRPMRCCCPATEDEIAAVLRYCSQHSIAVVPFGGGTSVVGGVDPDPRRFRGRDVAGPAAVRRAARPRRGVRRGRTGRRASPVPRPNDCWASTASRSATSRRASSSPPSAGSPRRGRRARTPRATAASTTWSAACGW